jgi:putative YhbY family RNA-binding protein
MPTLSAAERRALRARAHHLHPVVSIGQQGLTGAVLKEIDVALTAHELVKVRVFDDDRDAREDALARVCEALGCAPVQHLGKLLIVWRPKPEEKVEPAPPRPPKKRARPATRTGAAGESRKTPADQPRSRDARRDPRGGGASRPKSPPARRRRRAP